MSEVSGWENKSKWYKDRNTELVKGLLKIRKIIETLDLEPGLGGGSCIDA